MFALGEPGRATGVTALVEVRAQLHIGARIAGLAQSGEVLVSSTVHDLVAGSGIIFAARGVHQLKGIPGEWHLFAVV